MGGAVSSGETNDDLINNLMEAEYIKSPLVERVFRNVDRGFYYTKNYKQNPYEDLAWKHGNLHLSAPCIYSEVLENLKLEPGCSFLNIGSGTGYLSTMAGLILGFQGINHGIELHPDVVAYSRHKLNRFLRTSSAVDLFEFCEPHFVVGNCMDVPPIQARYDRIYCGAACPPDYLQVLIDALKVGGIIVVPVNESLQQITRVSETRSEPKNLLSVSFASLIEGSEATKGTVKLPEWNPLKLTEICRAVIRDAIRKRCVRSEPAASSKQNSSNRSKTRSQRNRCSHGSCVFTRLPDNQQNGNIRRPHGIVSIAYAMRDETSEEEQLPTHSDLEDTEPDSPPKADFVASLPAGSAVRDRVEDSDAQQRNSSDSDEDMTGMPSLSPIPQSENNKIADKEDEQPGTRSGRRFIATSDDDSDDSHSDDIPCSRPRRSSSVENDDDDDDNDDDGDDDDDGENRRPDSAPRNNMSGVVEALFRARDRRRRIQRGNRRHRRDLSPTTNITNAESSPDRRSQHVLHWSSNNNISSIFSGLAELAASRTLPSSSATTSAVTSSVAETTSVLTSTSEATKVAPDPSHDHDEKRINEAVYENIAEAQAEAAAERSVELADDSSDEDSLVSLATANSRESRNDLDDSGNETGNKNNGEGDTEMRRGRGRENPRIRNNVVFLNLSADNSDDSDGDMPPRHTQTLPNWSAEFEDEPYVEVNHPFTIQMRDKIKTLPLPPALKVFLHYNRDL